MLTVPPNDIIAILPTEEAQESHRNKLALVSVPADDHEKENCECVWWQWLGLVLEGSTVDWHTQNSP